MAAANWEASDGDVRAQMFLHAEEHVGFQQAGIVAAEIVRAEAALANDGFFACLVHDQRVRHLKAEPVVDAKQVQAGV